MSDSKQAATAEAMEMDAPALVPAKLQDAVLGPSKISTAESRGQRPYQVKACSREAGMCDNAPSCILHIRMLLLASEQFPHKECSNVIENRRGKLLLGYRRTL